MTLEKNHLLRRKVKKANLQVKDFVKKNPLNITLHRWTDTKYTNTDTKYLIIRKESV